jgi:hypothetical protein
LDEILRSIHLVKTIRMLLSLILFWNPFLRSKGYKNISEAIGKSALSS